MRRTEHLDLFGLDETATAEEIRAAYWRLAKELHPDINSTPEAGEAFLTITQAYRALRLTPAPNTLPTEPSTVEEATPPPPRAARGRWVGATAFSISIVGALIAANAVLRPVDRPGSEAVGPPAGVPKATARDRAAGAAPLSREAAPAAAGTPPILMGRSARSATVPSSPAVTSAPSPARTALANPAQRAPAAAPLQTAPVQPKPMMPSRFRQNFGGRPMRAMSRPGRTPPTVRRAAPLAAPFNAYVRPRERDRPVRDVANRPQKNAPVPAKPQQGPPTIESLAGKLLRSVLQ